MLQPKLCPTRAPLPGVDNAAWPETRSCAPQIQAFRSVLIQAGYVCTVRDSRGDDEMAACGQLGDVGGLGARAPVLRVPERFQGALLAAA